ncbi:class II aldolase/adducin family protein [Thermodesulfobacteriota bacterium]
MTQVPQNVVDNFVQACHKAAGRALVRCSSGNLSMRLGDDRLLVTSSRSWMESISADQVSVCRISDGCLLGGRKPTVEIGFHAGILRTRPDVKVVLHFQTPCATTVACQQPEKTDFFVIPEIPFYIGHVARVPYLLPGSKELANAVTDAMRDHDMVIMSNHGQVAVGNDVDHAIQNAEFFELACEVILRSGGKLTPLTAEDAGTLLELRRAAGSGAWGPARTSGSETVTR